MSDAAPADASEGDQQPTKKKDKPPQKLSRKGQSVLVGALAVATLLVGAALRYGLGWEWDVGFAVSVVVLWAVFWFAVILVYIVAKEPTSKEIGVALLTGLVLAGAAFVLNVILEDALASRERKRREAETKLAINRREQLVFRGEDLSGFDFTGMALIGTDERRFDLSFADLTETVFKQAELRRVLFRNATLHNVDFTDADLARANLSGAQLQGADFTGANLVGADLTDADAFDETGAVLGPTTICENGQSAVYVEPAATAGAAGTTAAAPGDGAATTTTLAPDEPVGWTCRRKDSKGEEVTARQLRLLSRTIDVGTPVGRIEATDSEGDPLLFEITAAWLGDERTAAGDLSVLPFAVDAGTGVLEVVDELTSTLYELDVTVTDSGDREVPTVRKVWFKVDQTNEAPEADVVFLVRATTPIGTKIGVVEAPDDWDDDVTFSIAAGDSGGLFDLDEENGVLKLDGRPTEGASYVLNVTMEEGEGNRTAALTVRVRSIGDNEPPVVSLDEPIVVPAGLAKREHVGFVAATDPDAEQGLLSYAIVGQGGQDTFSLDRATGELRVAADVLGTGVYELQVEVRDSGIPARSSRGTVVVRAEAPEGSIVAANRVLFVADGGTARVLLSSLLTDPSLATAELEGEVTEQAAAGEARFQDGFLEYGHFGGREPDRFAFELTHPDHLPTRGEVEVAVVTIDSLAIDTGASPSTEVVAVAVDSAAGQPIEYELADPSQSARFRFDADGALRAQVDGEQLFASGPWYDVEIVVRDPLTEATGRFVAMVDVRYLVQPNDGVIALVRDVGAQAGLVGRACPDDYREAVEARNPDAIDAEGGLVEGAVVVLPRCPEAGGESR